MSFAALPQDDCGGGSEAEPADQRVGPEAGLRGGRHPQPHLRLGALQPARPARVEAQRETGMGHWIKGNNFRIF